MRYLISGVLIFLNFAKVYANEGDCNVLSQSAPDTLFYSDSANTKIFLVATEKVPAFSTLYLDTVPIRLYLMSYPEHRELLEWYKFRTRLYLRAKNRKRLLRVYSKKYKSEYPGLDIDTYPNEYSVSVTDSSGGIILLFTKNFTITLIVNSDQPSKTIIETVLRRKDLLEVLENQLRRSS